METWLSYYRQPCIDEILRRDGIGGTDTPNCLECRVAPGVYRCLECAGSCLNCASCVVKLHKHSPLHRIEVSHT